MMPESLASFEKFKENIIRLVYAALPVLSIDIVFCIVD